MSKAAKLTEAQMIWAMYLTNPAEVRTARTYDGLSPAARSTWLEAAKRYTAAGGTLSCADLPRSPMSEAEQ